MKRTVEIKTEQDSREETFVWFCFWKRGVGVMLYNRDLLNMRVGFVIES